MTGWRPLAAVAVVALAVRALAVWWLGPGPFGPDGAGAAAAVALGGHPYPVHPLLIGITGGPRALSVLGGTLAAVAVAGMARALGGSPWAGLVAATAPLLVHASALAGGDAAATGLAALGVALAWRRWPLLGGALAGLALAVKPIAAPLWAGLVWASWTEGAPRFASGRALGAAVVATLPFPGLWDPLVRPRPGGGLLGSWWRSTGGAPPAPETVVDMLQGGLGALADLPLWTGLHLLALAALFSRRWGLLALALAAVAGPALLLGEQLRPRYLGPASVLLVTLAGLGRGAPALAGLLLWPAFAFISQLGALRAQEEQLPARPTLPWPDGIAVTSAYLDAGVCGATSLRALAGTLAEQVPDGGTVWVVRLRDGREGELTWPLQAARPDLRVEVLDGGRCADVGCVARIRQAGGPVVYPSEPAGCATPVIDPGEQALAQALTRAFGGGARYALWP
ncbi:MAG: hypothetical protein H6739_18715 [Alphaproteobacteria bacterium]|nr:hypothetical protein [Alphaproteobacteria bacterium]